MRIRDAQRRSTITAELLVGLIGCTATRTASRDRGAALRTELAALTIIASALPAAHLPPDAGSVAQFFEQRFGLFQILGVEALGEPVVDFGEHYSRLVTTTLFGKQTSEARGRL